MQRRRKAVVDLAKKTTIIKGDRGVYGNKNPLVINRKLFPSCKKIAAALALKVGSGVSPSTVRRDLIHSNFKARTRPTGPCRRETDVETRMAFCKAHSEPHDFQYLFTDEKYCDCNDHGPRREWVQQGEFPSHFERDRFSPKVLVWGCIGVGVKELVFLEEAVTAETYVEQCLKAKLHLLKRKKTIFVQDNARPHIALHTATFLHQEKILLPQPPWPVRSPDLNPLETLWARVQRAVDDSAPTSADELRLSWKNEWEKVPQSEVDALVLSFGDRCRACIKNNGKTLPSAWRKLLA
jgi:hypothetical protein